MNNTFLNLVLAVLLLIVTLPYFRLQIIHIRRKKDIKRFAQKIYAKYYNKLIYPNIKIGFLGLSHHPLLITNIVIGTYNGKDFVIFDRVGKYSLLGGFIKHRYGLVTVVNGHMFKNKRRSISDELCPTLNNVIDILDGKKSDYVVDSGPFTDKNVSFTTTDAQSSKAYIDLLLQNGGKLRT